MGYLVRYYNYKFLLAEIVGLVISDGFESRTAVTFKFTQINNWVANV